MNKKKIKSTPGEKRRVAIIDAALSLFMEKGYAAVSVDEIIRKSGGSKSSLYEFFGSKEKLFVEIVTSINDEILKEVNISAESNETTRETLTRIGLTACNQVLTAKGIGLFRLAVSVSTKFPKISRLFYEAGPRHTQQGVAEYLRKETEAGRLKIKNPIRAAEFFLGMILVKDHIAMPLGCAGVPSESKIKETVNEAVDVFLSAYGK